MSIFLFNNVVVVEGAALGKWVITCSSEGSAATLIL